VGIIRRRTCTCTQAPCGQPSSQYDGISDYAPSYTKIPGTIGSGVDCKCIQGLSGEITWSGDTASGECILELKDQFKEGEDKLWHHGRSRVKCCVSSAGLPTHLQDMNADELPSVRGHLASSDRTGCDFMFGETYQNGLKASTASCPVTIDKVTQLFGGGTKWTLLNLGLISHEEFNDMTL